MIKRIFLNQDAHISKNLFNPNPLCELTVSFIEKGAEYLFSDVYKRQGYDSITGVAIVFCGASAGFAGAFINPFTIQVAQGIAQLPLLSGMSFRIAMYICMVVMTTIVVMLYATKVKKNPQLSPMYEFDQTREDVACLLYTSRCV